MGIETSTRFAATNDLQKITGILKDLKLPVAGVEENLSQFIVLTINDSIAGVVGLEIYENKGLLRSLGVLPKYQHQGFGGRLFNEIIDYAKQQNISEIYLLTETAEPFFATRGFKKINREIADSKIKESVEFKSACPVSAVCMKISL